MTENPVFKETMSEQYNAYPMYHTRIATYQGLSRKITDCTAEGLISNI